MAQTPNKGGKHIDGQHPALRPVEEALTSLGSREDGLSDDEVAEKRKEYGYNELQGKEKVSKLAIFIGQFKDIMILILVAAAGISFVAGEHTDAFVILAIIIGNAILGYVQEYQAQEALSKLQQMAAQGAVVVRAGAVSQIEAKELVPGDVIILEAGNVIPADARLIEVSGLKVEEAALTGESVPVEKVTDVPREEIHMPADMDNMVFKSTSISSGSGKAVVTATGMQAEVGKIAEMLDTEEQQTPLQKKLSRFSKQLAVIVLVICAVIFGLGWLRGEPLLGMFMTALSLAVAALPEALPAVITISLARGAARMVKQNALIRRLPAVETLGSVTYICSDKTGTLTLNKMSVEKTEAAEGKEELLKQAMLLNHEAKQTEDGEWTGDPTETAFVYYAIEQGLTKEGLEKELPTEQLFPFDSERMLMASVHKQGDKWRVLVKGSPVKIAEKLNDKAAGEQWLEKNRQWAAEGLRVLFFADKVLDSFPENISAEELETGLEMTGMGGLIDPPREEVIGAIKECHDAGIETVMITGDQPLTAKAIAKELQLSDDKEDILSGADLKGLDEGELVKRVANTSVYARVSPEQKLNIVKALQENGHIVAMTGDGVNDAPSLKRADIGIAMGITGTDVSKEAAHMILLDDNFASIVKAVKEGRRIYTNIRKFIRYVLACNLGEILVILITPMLGLPIPLLPIHILWINLVTDGLPGLAIAAEPAEPDIMKQPPRSPQEPIFTKPLIINIIVTGIILTAASIGIQYWAISEGYDVVEQHTIVFTTLCFTQLGNALSVRAGNRFIWANFFRNKLLLGAILLTVLLQFLIIYIPWLDVVFKTEMLNWQAIIAVMAVTLMSTIALELIKMVTKRFK